MAEASTFPPRVGLAPITVIAPVCGMGISTLWRRVREGTFPKPIHIGPRSTRWRWEDVHQWLSQQAQDHGRSERNAGTKRKSRKAKERSR